MKALPDAYISQIWLQCVGQTSYSQYSPHGSRKVDVGVNFSAVQRHWCHRVNGFVSYPLLPVVGWVTPGGFNL
jgi:hypothetical protein